MNDDTGASERRRAKRTSVMLMATIDDFGFTTPVRLTNISSDGVAFVSGRVPAKGACVDFWRNSIAVSGRLAWAAAGRGGISFSKSLDAKEVLRPIPAPRPRHEVAFERPALKPGPLNQAEQNSIARCASLLGIAPYIP